MGLKHLLILAALVGCGDDIATPAQHEARPFVISPGLAPSLSTLTAGIPGTENGQTLAWNGTAWALNRYSGDLSQRYIISEEFETGTCATIGKFSGANSGTTTCTFTSSDDTHPGVLAITTGTTATEGERFATPAIVRFGGNTGTFCAKQLVKFQNLSTAVDQYVFRAGFAEPTSNADSVDAVEAVYQFSANGGVHKWALTTSQNSTRTTTKCDGTGGTVDAPIVAGTWYTLEECVNAAGTSATLAVNGTVCATNTTNIPTGSTRMTDVGLQCFNDSGSVPASQVCFIDYMQATLPFGVAR